MISFLEPLKDASPNGSAEGTRRQSARNQGSVVLAGDGTSAVTLFAPGRGMFGKGRRENLSREAF